jgi:two-component system, chemotaxis family, protein-glutamate methylesterase/glutaminase
VADTQYAPLKKYFPTAGFDVVALASSAGGLKALGTILSTLPATFPATLVVVQHIARDHPSLIVQIMTSRTALAVKQAHEGDEMLASTVYFAPSNEHLLVNPNRRLKLTQSELVHFVRPSADLLFASVATVFQERAIAVVLTGTGKDGSAGVRAIKEKGGFVIVQDEATSDFFGMPSSAIQTGSVDMILPLEKIAETLCTLVMTGGPA